MKRYWRGILLSRFPYIPKIICFKVINRYHNNLLVHYFGIEKTWEFIVKSIINQYNYKIMKPTLKAMMFTGYQK